MQNDEPQRPAAARPSLLSAGPAQGDTKSILGELESGSGKASSARQPARPGRKGMVVGTVLALAALGGTAALVMRDVNSAAQMVVMAQEAPAPTAAAREAAPAGGEPQSAAPGTEQPQQGADGAATALAPVAGTVAASDADPASVSAAGAAPAMALAAALNAPSNERTPAAATIIDTPPAAVEPKTVRKAAAKEHKEHKEHKPAPVKSREGHTRVAKAKAPAEKKIAKEKTHRKPARPQQASPDNDVELLAALVAHTRPQQPARTAPCPQGDDKPSGDGAACGGGQKR